MLRLLLILVQLAADAVRWCGLVMRSQRSIEAENLFLRRQLALYVERGVEPRRIDSVTRVARRSFHASFTGGTLWWWRARKR
jgi:putative transposase